MRIETAATSIGDHPRLAALAAALGGIAAARAGRDRPAEPWQLGPAGHGDRARRSDVRLVPRLARLAHRRRSRSSSLALLVASSSRFNEKPEPDAVADDAQHAARGRLDGGPGADPRRHRDPVLPAAARSSSSSRSRPRREGDRLAWYWGYEYPADQGGGFKFELQHASEAKDLKPGQPRLLAVDNEMVVPVGKVVRMQVTAADVLHTFAVPSFGFKIDAIPGRLNETWFKADREGVYLRPVLGALRQRPPYMPIAVRVVSEDAYAAWLAEGEDRNSPLDDGAASSPTRPLSRPRRANAHRI